MLQRETAAVIAMGAIALLAFAGCRSAAPSCAELALPNPSLSDTRIHQCVADVLADEASGRARFSLEIRAGARDVIVERRIVAFAPQLRVIASRSAADDLSAVTTVSFALDALTLLRDRDAVPLNARRVDADAPPLLVSRAISNLLFLGDLSMITQVEHVAETISIDGQRAAVFIPALRYLSAAGQRSPAVCSRLPELSLYADRCGTRCEPGMILLLRQAVGNYQAVCMSAPYATKRAP